MTDDQSTQPLWGRWRNLLGALVLMPVLGGVLSGCGITDMFGGEDDGERLPGERISVLALERELKPALDAINTEILLPAPEDTVEWPQTGGYSNHAMQHLSLRPVPVRAWRSGIGTGGSKRKRLIAAPIVAEGTVFTIDAAARVSAFGAGSGRKYWQVRTAPRNDDEGASLGGGLAYDKGRVFASNGIGYLTALDAATGRVLWRAKTEAPMRAAPTVNGNRVFVTTVTNQVVAFAAENGVRLWNYDGVGSDTILLGGATPAVDAGVVVAPFNNGELVALRADNGAVLWNDSVIALRRTEAAATLSDIAAPAVIDRGRVYAVGHTGLLVSIDLRSGQRVWEAAVAGVTQPWIAGNFLFATSVDAEVVAIDIRTGQVLWVTQLRLWEDEDDEEDRIVWSGPVLASDRLIVTGSHGEALSISPYTGAVIGRIETPDGIILPPAVANRTLYWVTRDGDLVAYH